MEYIWNWPEIQNEIEAVTSGVQKSPLTNATRESANPEEIHNLRNKTYRDSNVK